MIGFAFAFLSFKLQSSFSDKFSESILALLTTPFAINIASSTLIAGKIHEIQRESGYEFTKTKSNLRLSFYEQIIIIVLAFIVTLLRESEVLKYNYGKENIHLICNSILFACFIYYVDIIRDIGKALFQLLDFNKK